MGQGDFDIIPSDLQCVPGYITFQEPAEHYYGRPGSDEHELIAASLARAADACAEAKTFGGRRKRRRVPLAPLAVPARACAEAAGRRFIDPDAGSASGIPIVAVEGAREAHGVCPCDRRRPRAELETAFGDRDYSSDVAHDPWWQRDARESTAHLQQRALRFLGEVLSLRETHVAVVSHGVFIEMLHDYFLRDWPGCAATRRVMNCDTCTYGFVMENGPPPQLGTYLNPSLLAKVVAAGMSLVEVAAACALWRKYVPGGAFTSSQECVASLITREGKASASQARLLAHVLAAGSAADGAVSQRALLRLLACFFPLQRATAPPLPPSIAHARAAYLKDLHGTELQDERALSAIIKGIVGSAAAAQSTSSCATSGGHSASATTE
ncbi:hypothetical protein JKP88DRAFT_349863 [Tribonema minus]|uniref:Uncharacterized protein n=1 Tax=Tribonema minus TaxID=303371 RepID=A0A836CBQ0_9STRA|nr:hypothetical protein JKP88DRAFT_349863 [Tribonema minus]